MRTKQDLIMIYNDIHKLESAGVDSKVRLNLEMIHSNLEKDIHILAMGNCKLSKRTPIIADLQNKYPKFKKELNEFLDTFKDKEKDLFDKHITLQIKEGIRITIMFTIEPIPGLIGHYRENVDKTINALSKIRKQMNPSGEDMLFILSGLYANAEPKTIKHIMDFCTKLNQPLKIVYRHAINNNILKWQDYDTFNKENRRASKCFHPFSYKEENEAKVDFR